MRPFPVEIVGPEGYRFEGPAVSVMARTPVGDAAFLFGHVRFMAIVSGTVVVTEESGTTQEIGISGGVLSMDGQHLTLVAFPEVTDPDNRPETSQPDLEAGQ
jgi:F0F1-type ATP synthase epsilon subunit